MDTNLVVGAGFSGAVTAHLLADKLGEKVLVIDKKNILPETAMTIQMKTE